MFFFLYAVDSSITLAGRAGLRAVQQLTRQLFVIRIDLIFVLAKGFYPHFTFSPILARAPARVRL